MDLFAFFFNAAAAAVNGAIVYAGVGSALNFGAAVFCGLLALETAFRLNAR